MCIIPANEGFAAMPTYFFHITERNEFNPDRVGLEHADLAAIEKAAIEGASALIGEAVKKGEHDYRGRFDVEDERGEKVLTLTFACSIEIEVTPPCDESSYARSGREPRGRDRATLVGD